MTAGQAKDTRQASKTPQKRSALLYDSQSHLTCGRAKSQGLTLHDRLVFSSCSRSMPGLLLSNRLYASRGGEQILNLLSFCWPLVPAGGRNIMGTDVAEPSSSDK